MNNSKTISNMQRTGILITLLAGAFITAMSTTVTGNMISNFTEYFHVSSGLAQWLTSGATLLAGITIPITAFLIKRISNKIYFFSAMFSYTIGTLVVSLSRNFSMLLISRMIQAIGCGMLLSFAQVLLLQLYPKEKHGRIMAEYSMASTVSSVIGPTYAGLLIDFVGWRGVFISLFAIGILIIIAGTIFIRNVTEKQYAELNILFIMLSSLGFTSLLIGVNNLSGGFMHLNSGGLIFIGIILLAIFSVLQLKSNKPMLNLRIFKYPTFRTALMINMCLYLVSMGNGIILPIFTKTICMYSDTAYGLATIIGAVIGGFSTLFAGRIFDRFGIKKMAIISTILFVISFVMGILFSNETSIIYIGFVYAFQYIAMSILNSPTTTIALSDLKGQERVDGSAIYNTLRQISSSLASTISILIFTVSGSNLSAVRYVYMYFGIITIAIVVLIITYLKAERKNCTLGT